MIDARRFSRTVRICRQASAERWLGVELDIAIRCGLKVRRVTYKNRPVALIGRYIVGIAYEGEDQGRCLGVDGGAAA
jgi:hypothetical protein